MGIFAQKDRLICSILRENVESASFELGKVIFCFFKEGNPSKRFFQNHLFGLIRKIEAAFHRLEIITQNRRKLNFQ